MRNLTTEEQTTLRRRRAEFPKIVKEIKPGITDLANYIVSVHPDLAEHYGYHDHEQAAERPETFLPILEEFLQRLDVSASGYSHTQA